MRAQSRNLGPWVVTISDSQFLEKNIDIATVGELSTSQTISMSPAP